MSEQHTQSLPAHIKMALDGWVAEFNDLKAFKETATATIAELQRQLAEADAARRHAQEVSSDLVKEKREMEAQLAKATHLAELHSEVVRQLYRESKSFQEDLISARHELAKFKAELIPSETIASVTAWADETFGQATIERQILRAEMEFQELLHISQTNTGEIAEEAADVVICLYRVIGTLDPDAIDKKMAKNRARKWQVDGQGCAQHVGE